MKKTIFILTVYIFCLVNAYAKNDVGLLTLINNAKNTEINYLNCFETQIGSKETDIGSSENKIFCPMSYFVLRDGSIILVDDERSEVVLIQDKKKIFGVSYGKVFKNNFKEIVEFNEMLYLAIYYKYKYSGDIELFEIEIDKTIMKLRKMDDKNELVKKIKKKNFDFTYEEGKKCSFELNNENDFELKREVAGTEKLLTKIICKDLWNLGYFLGNYIILYCDEKIVVNISLYLPGNVFGEINRMSNLVIFFDRNGKCIKSFFVKTGNDCSGYRDILIDPELNVYQMYRVEDLIKLDKILWQVRKR